MSFPIGRLVRGVVSTSAGIGWVVLTCAAARAVPTYAVSFDDPDGAYSSYYGAITANVQAAGAEWANALGGGGGGAIDVRVGFGDIPTATGSSATSHFVGRDPASGLALYEQGAAARFKGDVAAGSGMDVRITIGDAYLTSELWFDPAPTMRDAAVPAAKTDAYSIFLHEFGHIYAFNGWRDAETGALPGAYASTFDRWVVRRDDDLFFEGPQAVSAYGGPVPLTYGDYGHLGNDAGRPGEDLIADLMGGVHFLRGTRYDISALDLAVAADVGLWDVGSVEEGFEPPYGVAAGQSGGVAGPAVDVSEPPSLVLLWALLPLAFLLHRPARGSWTARGLSPALR